MKGFDIADKYNIKITLINKLGTNKQISFKNNIKLRFQIEIVNY